MNNKSPQINIIFDRRKNASPTVKASIEIRITHNYKQKFLSTGIKLYSTQWKNGKIINCPDILQISQTLDKMITDIRQIIYEMMQRGTVDISAIPSELERKNKASITFLEFCKLRADVSQKVW